MAKRQQITVELDADVLDLLHARAAETGRTESELLQRAFCVTSLRETMAEIRSRSDLDEDAAMQLAREELAAARAERASRAA